MGRFAQLYGDTNVVQGEPTFLGVIIIPLKMKFLGYYVLTPITASVPLSCELL